MSRRVQVVLLVLAACSSKSGDPPAREKPTTTAPAQRRAAVADASVTDASASVDTPAIAIRIDAGIPTPPGTTALTNGILRSFGVGPGFVYWCDMNIYAAPKAYGLDVVRGPCDNAAFFEGDAGGLYYCDGRTIGGVGINPGVYRLPPETGSGELLTATEEACHVNAIDAENVYYVIYAFPGITHPGLFRVARSGGAPKKLMSLRARQDVAVAVDDSGLWVGSVWDGTIKRIAKSDGKATTVITGQKSVVEIVTDAEHVYWVVQSSRELRRRKKAGGPIEVVARKVDGGLHHAAGRLYWLEQLSDDFNVRLVRMSPGASEPQEVIAGLSVPVLAIDSDGIYFSELDKQGVFMMPHPP